MACKKQPRIKNEPKYFQSSFLYNMKKSISGNDATLCMKYLIYVQHHTLYRQYLLVFSYPT
uniref:C-CAP/cofactor C-like domain-containing protein n=1 Tax=Parascaris univalens TaxID=6257 RepID=A0A915C3P5_PARUN